MAAQGRYRDALALIKKENPFPAVCGRVCNRRCEDACTRGTVDQAVAIDAVKKFIAEQDLNAAHRYVPDVVQPSLQGPWPQKIAIIGGGPAGLSCAYFLAVQGYKPTVFEKNERPGGMLRYGIPSFKLEKNVIDAEIDILRELGVDIRCGVEVGKDVTLAELRRQGYRAFYIAIGCQGGRRAGVPGEDAAGIETAVHLLRTVGGDESRKMTGKTVVIGGGNVAIDAARVSLRCGSDDGLSGAAGQDAGLAGGNCRGRGGGHQNHLRLRPEGVPLRERPCDRRRAEKVHRPLQRGGTFCAHLR